MMVGPSIFYNFAYATNSLVLFVSWLLFGWASASLRRKRERSRLIITSTALFMALDAVVVGTLNYIFLKDVGLMLSPKGLLVILWLLANWYYFGSSSIKAKFR